MDKECYYFRHKQDQTLFAYLEYDKDGENTICFEFRLSEAEPHFFKDGLLCGNSPLFDYFRYISLLSYKQAINQDELDWFVIKPDKHLCIKVGDIISQFRNKESKHYQ